MATNLTNLSNLSTSKDALALRCKPQYKYVCSIRVMSRGWRAFAEAQIFENI